MKRWALLVLLVACRTDDPPWASSSIRQLGDDSIQAAPVAISRLPSAPVLDGKLDDAAWASSSTLGPFVDTGNGKEAAANHPSSGFARVGWDDRALYLGFVVRDPKAASPFARDDVDPRIWEKASGVEIMIQPGDLGDNVDYYEIQIDAAGAVFDTHWDDYMKPVTGSGPSRVFGHMDWQSKLERAVYVERGRYWSVEVALPWASLSPGRVVIPPTPGATWRLNLYAFRDGQRQALGWSSIRGEGNFHRARRWGRIRFE